MVEENFENQSSETLQNIFSLLSYVFSMVEEYFENQSSETLQNRGFSVCLVNYFTTVDENVKQKAKKSA